MIKIDEINTPELDNDAHLKYPRRTQRKIGDEIIKLSNPDKTRSLTMQKIKSNGSKIEQIIKNELYHNNIPFTKPEFIIDHIEGSPDFLIPKYKIAIFCDGDFWHGYKHNKNEIKNNSKFWDKKIERNIARDNEVNQQLRIKNWSVFRFWEHEIENDSIKCINQITNKINCLRKKASNKTKFTFVDLFAGIGGFRIPIEKLGGECLGFSEIDRGAIGTYNLNFVDPIYDNEQDLGDITKLNKLPFKVDMIVGGVPCQSWSVAGKMKGFQDPRGKLWEDTIRVVEINQPKVFIFENVKGLYDPRNKDSLELILNSFCKAGYDVVRPKLLNSYDFGVPQNRDRIFIVGFKKGLKLKKDFSYPAPLNKKTTIQAILDFSCVPYEMMEKKKFDPKEIHGTKIPKSRNRFQKEDELNDFFIFCDTRDGHTTIHSWDLIRTSNREKEICLGILKNRRKKKYGSADGNPLTIEHIKDFVPNIKPNELEKLISKEILRKNKDYKYEFVNSKNSAGINDIYRVFLPHSEIFSTLTATGTKDMISLIPIHGENIQEYKNNFIKYVYRKKKFRPINGKEAGRLQGFPEWFSINENEKIAKKQFGNAVSIPVIHHLTESILSTEILIDG